MERYYDLHQKRLIYIENSASEQFWDKHWQSSGIRRGITASPNSWVARTTQKYLPQGSRIIEGGCGLANHVYALDKHGYNV